MAKALGEIMKEQDERVDPRLERYAQGLLSEEERCALEEQALQDRALAVALELHRPLAPAFKAQLKTVAMNAPRAKVLWFRRPVVAVLAAAAAAAVLAAVVFVDRREVAPSYSLIARTGDAEW